MLIKIKPRLKSGLFLLDGIQILVNFEYSKFRDWKIKQLGGY